MTPTHTNGSLTRVLTVTTLAAALLVPAAALTSAQQGNSRARQQQIDRGKYLVSIAACHDCHSPKVDAQMTPDSNRPLSGRPQSTMPPELGKEIRASLDLTAWSGPWGNSYAANLTPDKTTGLGERYTEASFIQTIRTGKKPEGEQLQPPMPWPVYKNMTDDDLKAIYAYLRTLKPVDNFVRQSPAPAMATGR